MMETRILYLHALSALHTGTGQGTGIIDLPVAREVATNWPYLPGSTVKGVLRDACDPGDNDSQEQAFRDAFGPELKRDGDAQNYTEAAAGALWFSDAHLLCLPVRSMYGTFGWITCPLALARWQRDHAAQSNGSSTAAQAVNDCSILISNASALTNGTNGTTAYLDELDLNAERHDTVDTLAMQIAQAVFSDPQWQEIFGERFGIVSNNVFTFLTETGTEVHARIRLEDQQKTVERGGLWYEEAVPAESIFSCPIIAAPRNTTVSAPELYDVLSPALENPLQIGGSASIGRGLSQLRLAEVDA